MRQGSTASSLTGVPACPAQSATKCVSRALIAIGRVHRKGAEFKGYARMVELMLEFQRILTLASWSGAVRDVWHNRFETRYLRTIMPE